MYVGKRPESCLRLNSLSQAELLAYQVSDYPTEGFLDNGKISNVACLYNHAKSLIDTFYSNRV